MMIAVASTMQSRTLTDSGKLWYQPYTSDGMILLSHNLMRSAFFALLINNWDLNSCGNLGGKFGT